MIRLRARAQPSAVADEALLRSRHAAVPPPAVQTGVIYVNKAGSDTTGNGTDNLPFLTVGKGLALAKTISSPTFNPLVVVGPGIYTENVKLLPWVFLIGQDYYADSFVIDGTVTLDPSWAAPPGGGDPFGGIESAILLQPVTIDFHVGGGVNLGNVIFSGIIFESTFTGIGFDPGINTIACDHIFMNVTATSMTGLNFETSSCIFFEVSILSSASLPGVWISQGDTCGQGGGTGGTVTGDSTAGHTVALSTIGTQMTGPLNLAGAGTTFTGSAGGIPPVVNLSGGAAAPAFGTHANGIGYTPAVAGNWVGTPPSTVQQALDRIAANTTNAHPIP